ncbi:MAG: response regulator, partial [candidate division Zixibacteria bacterium]|nr:response regulator [candidate division Zixibacteria bacterium]
MVEKTRVLIVDDERDFAGALAERMQNRGLEVDTAYSGPEALKFVASRTYHAVVLDLAMPGMDGIETLQRMLSLNADLQVILLTGRATVDKGEHHYETILNVVREAAVDTHWPTVALAVLAFTIMIVSRRINPRIPSVLIAVVAATLVSWSTGSERTSIISIEQIESQQVRNTLKLFNAAVSSIDEIGAQRVALRARRDSLAHDGDGVDHTVLDIEHQIALLSIDLVRYKEEARTYRADLRRYHFALTGDSLNSGCFHLCTEVPSGLETDGRHWRLLVGNGQLDLSSLEMSGGGALVGVIPRGLPTLASPHLDLSAILSLLPMAMIISLLGFMEAISIAKAMAAKTGQRLDANQELVGQGLANLLGSFTHSYAVSGSFSRSAVNIQAGAVTGLSNVVSSLVVVVVLLFFTPLLYHLPQSVLAAIIMMAVAELLNLKSFVHAWRAQWYDGLIGITTFVCTLAFAPHLDRGIIIGVALSVLLYLIRNMKPVIAMLSLHVDGTYRNRTCFDLKQCPYIAVIRYAGSLMFSNVD